MEMPAGGTEAGDTLDAPPTLAPIAFDPGADWAAAGALVAELGAPSPAVLFSLAALPVFSGALEAFSLASEVAADAEDAFAAPVVLDAWLFGLLLVALVCPLLGLVEFAEAVSLAPELMLASAGLLLFSLLVDFPALGLIVSCSFTCLTPEIDFATSFARFLSALAGTEPVIVAVAFVTETCTLAKAGS
jgi:hypothetical protein